MHFWDTYTEAAPPKDQLAAYCAEVEVYINIFIDTIDHYESKNTKTKLDVFLGQIRHASHHIGFLHSVFHDRNHWSEDLSIPPNEAQAVAKC
jgi:hypothetical protein